MEISTFSNFSCNFIIVLITCFISFQGAILILILKHDRIITRIEIQVKILAQYFEHVKKKFI